MPPSGPSFDEETGCYEEGRCFLAEISYATACWLPLRA
jgi:hypothetical protein